MSSTSLIMPLPAAGTLSGRRLAALRRLSRLDLLMLVLVVLADIQVLWTWGVHWGYYDSDWLMYFHAAQRLQRGQEVYTVVGEFRNPPQFLLLVRALLPLGYIASRLLWCVLSAALLALSVPLLAAWTGVRLRPRTQVLAALVVLSYTPTMLLIPTASNTSAPVVFCYALGLWLLSRGRDGLAGAVFALTLIKPQLGFLILPLLLYKGRWRAVAAYLGVVIVSSLLSWLLVGRATVEGFLAMQRITAQGASTEGLWLRDIPGLHAMFLQWWSGGALAGDLAYLVGLGLLLALAHFWRGPWRADSPAFLSGWGLLVLIDLLVAPYAHSDDLVLLVIPAAALAGWLLRSARAPADELRWIRPVLLGLFLAPVLVVYCRQHFMVPAMLAAAFLLWRLGRRELGTA